MLRVADVTVAPPGAVAFRFSLWRFAATMVVLAPSAYAISIFLLAVVTTPFGGTFAGNLTRFSPGYAAFILVAGLSGAGLATWRRPPWVRVSDAGIELARTQRDPCSYRGRRSPRCRSAARARSR